MTRILDPATWTWSTVGNSPFDGMSAVMYRPNKIMKSGAWADPDFNGAKTFNAHGRTAVIDMSAGSPTWRETAPMAFARSYHNLTLLPDGTVLASGGQSNSDGTRSLEVGPSRRDLEPRHRDVDDRRLAPERAPLPLDGAAAARRPRADGRRRCASRSRDGSEERRALLAAVPLQGRRDRRSRRRPGRSSTARAST